MKCVCVCVFVCFIKKQNNQKMREDLPRSRNPHFENYSPTCPSLIIQLPNIVSFVAALKNNV